ncbi:MAG: altronate dehydratase family protein [Clostridiales bacterium]|jgi:altronate hydrolase|nr:altronate dehydratase family protein [Clostridiales bacterium]
MKNYIKINATDNVAVALVSLNCGDKIKVDDITVELINDIPQGHKFAILSIKEGEKVVKYGNVIGVAKKHIGKGEHVHSHNLVTSLSGKIDYKYHPKRKKNTVKCNSRSVKMYRRSNGEYGIRNELWIVPTVGCVNGLAQVIANEFNKTGKAPKDGLHIFAHPFGCSQIGDDHIATKKILRSVVKHPNIGGVLVLGLGCENNQMSDFVEFLGSIDNQRVKFLIAQQSDDEIAESVEILEELSNKMSLDVRVDTDISNLKIGLKCGGSDALSGVTANPLLGFVCDYLTDVGGTAVLTEVPEMFGAEHTLMERAENSQVFDSTVKLINDFKDYFTKQNQPIYENPSPGNKAGGITTLEEKSLGAIQKGGHSIVRDVLEYGERCICSGLNLLSAPGNDIVAVTALGAAGCHIVLFTTGRGTPLGGFIPIIKVATNDELAQRKQNWIDFNAGAVLTDGFEVCLQNLLDLIIETANGKNTKNELNQIRDIAIFKSGVTL